MAWEARSGLKHTVTPLSNTFQTRLNGLGSPFGIETAVLSVFACTNFGLNGLGSPFGIETCDAIEPAFPGCFG